MHSDEMRLDMWNHRNCKQLRAASAFQSNRCSRPTFPGTMMRRFNGEFLIGTEAFDPLVILFFHQQPENMYVLLFFL